MKSKYTAIISGLLIFFLACSGNSKDASQYSSYSFNVVFTNGLTIDDVNGFGGSTGKKIYNIWAETTNGNFIQNIWVCQKSVSLKLTSYWYANIMGKATSEEINAVTGATHSIDDDKNIDFTIENISLNDSSIRSFCVFFEIDRSWDKNNWFYGSYDQPAIMYKALVDLDSTETEFVLKPAGWTARSTNDISSTGYIPDFALGVLNPEMRYITNLKNLDNSIGDFNTNTEYSALSMVGSIKVTVNK